jgi:thioredoxin
MRRRMLLFTICALILCVSWFVPQIAAAEGKVNLQALKAKRVPILLDFGRGWCIPCKHMMPILDDMSKAYAGRAIVTFVNLDANQGLARHFKIRLMPTQIFLTPDGKEFFRHEGVFERDQIAQVFAKMGLAPRGAKGGVAKQTHRASTGSPGAVQ